MAYSETIDDEASSNENSPLPFGKGTVFSIGGDRKKTDDTSFSKIVFDDLGSPAKPQIDVSLFSEALDQQRILIIAGKALDKVTIARQCAWQKAELESDLASGSSEVDALHYRVISDTDDVFQHIESKAEPTVFVITAIEPSKFSRNLMRLQQAIQERHWVIFTTDHPREAWHITAENEIIWCDTSDYDLYLRGDIVAYFKTQISDVARKNLPFSETSSAFDDCAVSLGTPTAIESFLRQVERSEGELSQEEFDTILKTALSDQESVELWFRYGLEEREKSIAIALALFNGVDEDLVFTAIDTLMEQAWRKRDSALLFVDYSDLEPLLQYFTFDQDANSVRRLRTVGEETDATILKTAWPTHRRQIVAALPVLTSLVLETVDDESHKFGLHRSDDRLEFLRETIGQSLGEIGTYSLDSVEGHLLKLIATGKIDAIKTVAIALRRIRDRAPDKNVIFPMLERWKRHSDLHRWLQFGTKGNKNQPVEEIINLAIAYMLGKLALEDEENQISEKILSMMLSYAKSDDTNIIRVLSVYSLPELIYRHSSQMSEKFSELIESTFSAPANASRYLCQGMGYGLSLASRSDDPTLLELMLRWKDEGLQNAKTGVDLNAVGAREKELATVCFAMGYTPERSSGGHSAIENQLTPPDAMKHLGDILDAESHPFVRETAISAVCQLIEDQFTSVKTVLYLALEQMKADEHPKITAQLVDLHRRQRAAQEDGDTYIYIDDFRYPIWYDRDPVDTEVLKAFFDWSGNSGSSTSPVMAQFASSSVNEVLLATENEEVQVTKRLREEREKEQKRQDKLKEETVVSITKKTVELTFFQKQAVSMASTSKTNREAVEGILATILPMSETARNELIARYKKQDGISAANAEAAHNAYKISKNLGGWIVMGLIGGAIVIAILVGVNS